MQNKQDDSRESDLPKNLSQPAYRALAGAGIQRLEQLTQFREAEIKKLHGIGPNALRKLNQALAAKGLAFAAAIPNLKPENFNEKPKSRKDAKTPSF